MALNRNFQPNPTLKAGFIGQPGRGKTHGCCSLVIAACRELALPGDIALLGTEDWMSDWHDRLKKHTGKAVIPCLTTDPTEALKFLRECEADGGVSMLVVDSMSELMDYPRKRWVQKNGKAIPLNLYTTIDAPYKAFCEAMKFTQLHWAVTMREDDEKLVIDDQEVTIGKKAKAGDFGYVPRLKVHCSLKQSKQDTPAFKWVITDCGGETSMHVNAKSDVWLPMLQRYKLEQPATGS
jgi:hypothetical protein